MFQSSSVRSLFISQQHEMPCMMLACDMLFSPSVRGPLVVSDKRHAVRVRVHYDVCVCGGATRAR